MSLHNLDETISIFSDEVLDNPLLLFLLISSLNHMGYASIEINFLTKTSKNYTKLKALLDKTEKLKYIINTYKTAQELIDSGNKIDIYLTDLTFPQANSIYCNREVRIPKRILSYGIIGEHSDKTNKTFFISTKTTDKTRQKDRNEVFEQLIKNYIEKNSPVPEDTKIGKYTCESAEFSNSTLVDIIYLTRKSASQKVPLFNYKSSKTDTGTGIEIATTIIEALLNFEDYSDLLTALFKIELARSSDNFNTSAQSFELFTYDSNNKEFKLLNNDLNNIKSTIKIFLRYKKTVAPTETTVSD